VYVCSLSIIDWKKKSGRRKTSLSTSGSKAKNRSAKVSPSGPTRNAMELAQKFARRMRTAHTDEVIDM